MMKIAKLICATLMTVSATGLTQAAITAQSTQDFSVPGVVQNHFTVDTDSDFLVAVVLVELTAGTLHNPNSIVPGIETFQNGVGDTFVTANGNPNTGIAGGAGDLSPTAPAAATFDPTLLGVSWFSPGADQDDIGIGLPIGTFSFTSDAIGTWQLIVINANQDKELSSGIVINGLTVIPEPATLGLLGLGGLMMLRRRH